MGYARLPSRSIACSEWPSCVARNLDARDLLPPFTPGALRGGTHVHQFSPDGHVVSSTYEDHVLVRNATAG